MIVDDLFFSIQGEGTESGLPTYFIRLYGCNIKCSYCDQKQSPQSIKNFSIEDIVRKVISSGASRVCITGGEPLVQKDTYLLAKVLSANNLDICIETNGCVEIDTGYLRYSDLDAEIKEHIRFIMDIKLPSSNCIEYNQFSNLANLRPCDEVKMVIRDREDFDCALDILSRYPTKAQLLFSPMFDPNDTQHIGQELTEWVLSSPLLRNARIQIQLHKMLNCK